MEVGEAAEEQDTTVERHLPFGGRERALRCLGRRRRRRKERKERGGGVICVCPPAWECPAAAKPSLPNVGGATVRSCVPADLDRPERLLRFFLLFFLPLFTPQPPDGDRLCSQRYSSLLATASGPPAKRVSRGRQRFEAGQAGRGSRAPPSSAVLVHMPPEKCPQSPGRRSPAARASSSEGSSVD